MEKNALPMSGSRNRVFIPEEDWQWDLENKQTLIRSHSWVVGGKCSMIAEPAWLGWPSSTSTIQSLTWVPLWQCTDYVTGRYRCLLCFSWTVRTVHFILFLLSGHKLPTFSCKLDESITDWFPTCYCLHTPKQRHHTIWEKELRHALASQLLVFS